jgi:alkylhydroperoxidase/carboxymuconolactone decarboxylase family protein YurZ
MEPNGVAQVGSGAPASACSGALSAGDRALLGLVAPICESEFSGRFHDALTAAFAAGLGRDVVKEALLHLVIYASFPKVLCALRVLHATPEPANCTRGLVGLPPANLFFAPEVRTALEGIDLDFADIALRMAGEVWGRGGLTQRERALSCIAAHIANRTPALIPFHARIAFEAGGTAAELREVVSIAAAFAPRRIAEESSRELERFLLGTSSRRSA